MDVILLIVCIVIFKIIQKELLYIPIIFISLKILIQVIGISVERIFKKAEK